MGQRDQCVARVEITLIAAVIGFKGPERQQNTARYAILCFDLVENGFVFAGIGAPRVDAILGNQAAGKVDKRFLEHALRPVGSQNLGILLNPLEEPVHCSCVVAAGFGLGLHVTYKVRKRPATLRHCRPSAQAHYGQS